MSQYWYTVSENDPERERLSMTPVYRTVQEGLSMVSCREGITKSKHVLYIYIYRHREKEM